uniref:Coiled-coil-helix-coiled-coil-helix domain-containing protein mitochondrial n=1 Tax=Triatoma infestans TaxID=30076 RepID=A0A161MDE8_TRIIF
MSRRRSPGRGSPPPRVPSRPYSKSVPTRTAPPPPRVQQKPPGSSRSLFRDMAATAGGVAVGSAVGHAVGAGITGMFSGGEGSGSGGGGGGAVAAQEPPPQGPCAYEIIQLLECAQHEDDLTMCQALGDVFRKCMKKHGYD